MIWRRIAVVATGVWSLPCSALFALRGIGCDNPIRERGGACEHRIGPCGADGRHGQGDAVGLRVGVDGEKGDATRAAS